MLGRVPEEAVMKLFEQRPRLLWLTVNIIGMAAFLILASQFWTEPELAEVSGASLGDAFGWFFTAVPIVLVAFVWDFAWFITALRRERGRDRADSISASIIVAGLWIIVLYIDNAHHGT